MRATTLRHTIGFLAVLALCAGTACSGKDAGSEAAPTTTAPKPHPGGRIVYGLEGDPNGLDPTRNAWDTAGIQLANALYDPIAAFDADGHVKPYLAESLTPNADFTAWRLTLRPGVTFHNGKPATVEAALTFIAAVRKSAITGPAARNIADARQVDDRTVEITMVRPWATFPSLLTGQGGYVVAPDQLTDAGGKDGRSNPIGTGPFMLKSWKTDERFELVKNPHYWRTGLPYLDGIEFVVKEGGQDRLDQMARGTMDATAFNRLNHLRELDAQLRRPDPGIVAHNDTSDAEKDAVIFNTAKPPFDDLRVRQAIAQATDVRALAAKFGWPADRAAPGLLSPTSPYFLAAPYPQPDVERARALVRDYLADPKVRGKVRDIAFTVTTAEFNADWVQELAAQWARAGIVARLNLQPGKQLTRFLVTGNYEVAVARFFAAEDPDVLWHFFVSDTVSDTGISLNFPHFRNDALTAAFNDGRATPDPAARKAAYARVQTVLGQQVPVFWLNRIDWRIVTTPRVRDARNVTLPDGSPAQPYLAGTYRMTETWIDG